jgi:hypothetical protein
MSAFVLALAAGMAADTGPEMVPGEAVERLDLCGVWEGTWDSRKGRPSHVTVSSAGLFPQPNSMPIIPWKLRDEGGGNLQIEIPDSGVTYLGIYRQEKDRVFISLRFAAEGRPTSFRIGGAQSLLTLRRVKPGK